MGNIPLPALSVQAPRPADLFTQVGKLAQLQSSQLENQQRAQQIKDQQATTQAMLQWDPKAGYDALAHSVLQNGGSAATAMGMVTHGLELRQKTLEIAKADEENNTKHLENLSKRHDLLLGSLNAVLDGPDEGLGERLSAATQQAQQDGLIDAPHAQQISQFAQLPPDRLRPALAVLEKGLLGEKEQFSRTMKEREVAATETTAGAHASQAQTAAQRFALETPGLQAQGQMAQQNLAANPTNIALGQAEKRANIAKTKLEIQNMGEQPIFAVDPATNERVMTTRPEAQAKGYTNPVPVKEGDVSKETDARAMINDVQLNKSRYLAAMQRVYAEPMTTAQQTALVALTPERLGVDFGSLFKLELPDVMQKVSNASAFSVLSPAQKQAVVGYYSTLASVPAAQKALTNIGRANKEMMDLELRTIPTPIMDQGTFQTMLDRFQGNIEQTSRKTVRMPGMPSTDDIRNLHEGRQGEQRKNLPNLPPDVQGLVNGMVPSGGGANLYDLLKGP